MIVRICIIIIIQIFFTKIYEDIICGDLENIHNVINDRNQNNKPLKGEIVIIVGGYDFSTDLNIEKLKLIIENKLKKHTLRDTVKLITEETNISKKIIYKEAIKIINTIQYQNKFMTYFIFYLKVLIIKGQIS